MEFGEVQPRTTMKPEEELHNKSFGARISLEKEEGGQ
jgi:hypothetical protein